MDRNLKIQNHRILDICLEIISTKFGWSRSKINKIKTRDIFTYKTYIQTMKNGTVAPPCVKFHVEIPSAVLLYISGTE